MRIDYVAVWKAAYAGSHRSRWHGPAHWMRVHANAVMLAAHTDCAYLPIVRLFAILHDCRRRSDGRDRQHGRRAADLALGLCAEGVIPHELRGDDLNYLCYALTHHDEGLVTSNPTIGCCWDADRLDLTRCGIVPDPRLMSTAKGRELAQECRDRIDRALEDNHEFIHRCPMPF